MPDYAREAAAGGRVAGVDEVGRGCWAGPVFAAAAILSPRAAAAPDLAALDDSKAIGKRVRERCFDALKRAADDGEAWLALGRAEVEEIDELNILGATGASLSPPQVVSTDPAEAQKLSDPPTTIDLILF